jgi:hypothetical protein
MTRSCPSFFVRGAGGALASALAFGSLAGCATIAPPFDKMKDQPMTVYRLQNYEVPAQPTATATAPGALQLPPQIQQWIQAGASLLPPGLLPPGLLPGSAPAAPPPPDVPRFHNFRILDYQVVTDPGVNHDIVDVFGHASNFQGSASNCMFAEFGFAMAQPNGPTADILVSLSCEQVQAFNISWPYSQSSLAPDASKKIASIAQRVFQGR